MIYLMLNFIMVLLIHVKISILKIVMEQFLFFLEYGSYSRLKFVFTMVCWNEFVTCKASWGWFVQEKWFKKWFGKLKHGINGVPKKTAKSFTMMSIICNWSNGLIWFVEPVCHWCAKFNSCLYTINGFGSGLWLYSTCTNFLYWSKCYILLSGLLLLGFTP